MYQVIRGNRRTKPTIQGGHSYLNCVGVKVRKCANSWDVLNPYTGVLWTVHSAKAVKAKLREILQLR